MPVVYLVYHRPRLMDRALRALNAIRLQPPDGRGSGGDARSQVGGLPRRAGRVNTSVHVFIRAASIEPCVNHVFEHSVRRFAYTWSVVWKKLVSCCIDGPYRELSQKVRTVSKKKSRHPRRLARPARGLRPAGACPGSAVAGSRRVALRTRTSASCGFSVYNLAARIGLAIAINFNCQTPTTIGSTTGKDESVIPSYTVIAAYDTV